MIASSPWRFVGASVKGTSHAISGTPCQDFCLVTPLPAAHDEPLLVLCVADGAGSATHAATGSRLACSTFTELLISHLTDRRTLDIPSLDTVRKFVTEMIERLDKYAYSAELTIRDLACTFLGAIIAPAAAICIQIGDGAIVLGDGEDNYRTPFWPQSGEYANTTYFLTDGSALDQLQYA